MAALTASVAPSLASEYAPSNGWLTQDTNPTGKGPVTTGPVEPLDNPVDGTAAVTVNPPVIDWAEPDELAEQAPDYFAESAFPHAARGRRSPSSRTARRHSARCPMTASPRPGSIRSPRRSWGSAVQGALPGHDAHSQDTDTAGWDQYTPSGRTAVRQSWAQYHPGVDNFWPVTQPNHGAGPDGGGARTRTSAGVVAQYGDLASSGGDVAYEAPAPGPTYSPRPGRVRPRSRNGGSDVQT